MSLDNAAENCQLEDYPGSSQYPAAVNYMESLGLVLACGGKDLADSSKCWAFDGSSWTSLPDSIHGHCYDDSPSLIVDQGWWVTGRLQIGDGSCSATKTTCGETGVIFTGEEWIKGPPHPIGYSRYYSCLAQVNSTHSLYTGGQRSWTKSWLFPWTEGHWTGTGELNEGRMNHGCAVLEDQGVLVAGGRNEDDDRVYSVELYDPETGIWTLQPSLPQEIEPSKPVLLPWDSAHTVIALFQSNNEVYQRAEDGTWSALEGVLLPELISSPHYGATVVPDDFAYGCV